MVVEAVYTCHKSMAVFKVSTSVTRGHVPQLLYSSRGHYFNHQLLFNFFSEFLGIIANSNDLLKFSIQENNSPTTKVTQS